MKRHSWHRRNCCISGDCLFEIALKNLISEKYAVNLPAYIFLITEALDKQLRIKIRDKNCEWRFDESFIIFKFVKAKSQILVSSLYTKMCVEISLHVIKNTTMWNVESDD